MRTIKTLIALLILIMAGSGTYLYAGIYPVGADAHHSKPVYWLLQFARDRAITVQSASVHVPANLNDPKRLLEGAGQYAAMCSGCHLAPGYDSNETSKGLYPKPPRLAVDTGLTPAQVFWVLKHGVKMSGMPAWGPTHSDDELWSITAFVQQLPKLDAQQYKDIVAKAPMDPDMTIMPMPQGKAVEDDHDGA